MPIVIEEMNIEISVKQEAGNAGNTGNTGDSENANKGKKELVQQTIEAVMEVLNHQKER